MVTVPLESVYEIADVLLEILLVVLCTNPVDTVGGVLADQSPAVEQELLVDQNVEVPKLVLLLLLSLLC
jgi:hypothetical protein